MIILWIGAVTEEGDARRIRKIRRIGSTGTAVDILRRFRVVLHQDREAGIEHAIAPVGNRPKRMLIQ